LERNAALYGSEKCLTEINLDLQESHNVIWREYELIENNPAGEYRRDMTWKVFDEKANRFANLLIKRGIKKGDKVAILLMNCLEWLPIYDCNSDLFVFSAVPLAFLKKDEPKKKNLVLPKDRSYYQALLWAAVMSFAMMITVPYAPLYAKERFALSGTMLGFWEVFLPLERYF